MKTEKQITDRWNELGEELLQIMNTLTPAEEEEVRKDKAITPVHKFYHVLGQWTILGQALNGGGSWEETPPSKGLKALRGSR